MHGLSACQGLWTGLAHMPNACPTRNFVWRVSQAGSHLPTCSQRVQARINVLTRAGTAQPVPGVGKDRQLWLPGVAPPAHLDGTLPGDYG